MCRENIISFNQFVCAFISFQCTPQVTIDWTAKMFYSRGWANNYGGGLSIKGDK